MSDRQELLQLAVNTLNRDEYPFSVTSDGEQLIAAWKWKDAALWGKGTVSKEVSRFRYVVKLREDGTFYDFDADEEDVFMAAGSGHINARSRAFTGQKMRFHREIAFGKNAGESRAGLHTYDFSTKQIHEPIRQFLECNGWKYREQKAFGVQASGRTKVTYLLTGLFFTLLGVAGVIDFMENEAGGIVWLPGIFVILGIWSFLTGAGVIKIPVFSKRFGIAMVFGCIFMSIVAAFGITEVLLVKYMPEIILEEQKLRGIFHMIEVMGLIGCIVTLIVYKAVGRGTSERKR